MSTEPRQQRGVERRESILRAAADVFGRQGYHGASVRRIAAAAGVNEALIYYYFRNKEALLDAVIERRSFAPEVRRLLREGAGRPPEQALEAVAAAFLGTLFEDARFSAMLLAEAQRDPRLARRLGTVVDDVVKQIRHFLDGEAGFPEPGVAARALVNGLLGYFLTEHAVRGEGRPDTDRAAYVRRLVRGLAAPSG